MGTQARQTSGRSGGLAGGACYDYQNVYVAWQLAEMLRGNADPIDEGTGSALAGSVVFFSPSLKDADPHWNIDHPIARVGRAGGALTPAGHVICRMENTHVATWPTCTPSTLRWFGLDVDDFPSACHPAPRPRRLPSIVKWMVGLNRRGNRFDEQSNRVTHFL